MTESVVIQIIITLGAVIVAIISLMTARANRQDVKDVKDQVKNTHSTNLRSDIDDVKLKSQLTSNAVHRIEVLVNDFKSTITSFEESNKHHTSLQARALSEIREKVSEFGNSLSHHINHESPANVRKAFAIGRKEMRDMLNKHEKDHHDIKETDDEHSKEEED